ncbi:MAG: hypothetical protein KDB80_06545, partial [Planctomycetes bacterium]|nr:hypothetical protein [Planctomycetota bacterium]
MNALPTVLALALATATTATAQRISETQARDLLAGLMIPIHDSPNDPHGLYGIWAGAPGYKASFHDGFTFYPVVGAEHEHQPLSWRTAAIRVGERALELHAPREEFSDWRFERRYDCG